jgi:hypothetical protein
MTLGKIKQRHEAAVRQSPFAKKLKKTTKNTSTDSKLQFRTRKSRPGFTTNSPQEKTRRRLEPPSHQTVQSKNGFTVGDQVRCVWKSDGKRASFVGKLVEIRVDGGKDFYFTMKDRGGILFDYYTKLCKLTHATR